MRHLFILLSVSLLASCASADKDYLVTIQTEYGDMKAILYDQTPKHKENFIKLAKDGFYDSTIFHRVIKDFMIQGGDPNSKNSQPGTPLGNGGPGYTIPAEFDKDLFHVKGSLSAARQSDRVNPEKESSGSQFYIVQGKTWSEEELSVDMDKLGMATQQLLMQPRFDTLKQMLRRIYETQGPDAYGKKLVELKDLISREMQVSVEKSVPRERVEAYTTIGGAPHLDDEYTVFGKVISGLEVIDKIAAQPTNRRDRPQENIMVIMSVEELPKKKITKMYGYEYPTADE